VGLPEEPTKYTSGERWDFLNIYVVSMTCKIMLSPFANYLRGYRRFSVSPEFHRLPAALTIDIDSLESANSVRPGDLSELSGRVYSGLTLCSGLCET